MAVLLLFSTTLAAEVTPAKKPLVTFLELGSASCIPCRMMQPVMEDVAKHYGDRIDVVFIDIALPKNRAVAMKHKVRVMPTQVFLDESGKEFFRHEGFHPKEQLMKMLDAYYKSLDTKKDPEQ
jgi:thioredoxin 1